jgi:predicted dehydrogenase/threonine dehydrogenase-like Zn-dependent dehydrogenase
MYQVTDNYWTGKVELEQVCAPTVRPGGVLVRTAFSLISAGTERMKVQQAQMSLVGKARARPDQVASVMGAITRDGLAATYEKVMNRLKTPVPLGYSLSGQVIAVGDGVEEFRVGDRVACAGSTANHAEFNFVPKNLCARVPDGVPLDLAACTTVGAIALQGVRQANAQLGELVAVIGLGLVGQFCVQLLTAAGCKIIGLDLENSRLELARAFGAAWAGFPDRALAVRQVEQLSSGIGADVVLVTASSSNSEPMHLAAELARDRARIVDIGKTHLDLPWEVFYEKELDLRMSRSYGPGRYDPSYEERGIDYPVGYVRWTEKRNMQLFLDLLAQGKVQAREIINQRFAIGDGEQAYRILLEDKSALGILLQYDSTEERPKTRVDFSPSRISAKPQVTVGVIGAGNHCKSMFLPKLRKETNVVLGGICTATGLSATDTARRFGFQYATSDAAEILDDQNIDAIVIATRHDLHGPLAMASLRKGRSVFVEKPLTLREDELAEIETITGRENASLMVGYNRRFAPHVVALANWMHSQPGSWIATYRVNAGSLPANHWHRDPVQGGGRLLAEVCHFVDLLCFLFRSHPQRISAASAFPADSDRPREEHAVYTLGFGSGSLGQIVYTSEGDPSIPKERLEIVGNGGVAVLDNFRRLSIVQNHKKTVRRAFIPDKGHGACLKAFVQAALAGAAMPIPLEDIFAVSRACFQLKKSLRENSFD